MTNEATGDGGGLYLGSNTIVGINNSNLMSNTSPFGGGINSIGNSLVINNSKIAYNAAREGAGVRITSQTAQISDSAIYNNSGFSPAVSKGGGIFNGSLSVTITNSTISGNSALDGGGIYNAGRITLNSITLSDNSAESIGGGIFTRNTMVVHNAIVANSASGGDCVLNAGTIMVTHSLIEDGSCGAQNGNANFNLNGDPKLDSLGNNGGTTQTHALQSDSPAINMGDSANCPTTESARLSAQRQHVRYGCV